MSLERGARLGGWTLIAAIGHGGNGEVWRASHASHGEGAIKILHSFQRAVQLERRRKRFLAEIDRLRALPDLGVTGVMPILDSAAGDDDTVWFAMPLANRLVAPPERVPWALGVAVRLAETLAFLHQVGIVHRDVKPANVLLVNGEITLSDFGLARGDGDDPLTATGEQVGSAGYVAPECLTKSDEPQFSCDVYSLAKTLWVLLTGEDHPPQAGLNDPADSLLHRGIDRAAELQPLLSAATERDSLDRPTMRQLANALKTTLSPPAADQAELLNRPTGPATRAMALFKDEAATNRRRQEVESACSEVAAETRRVLMDNWSDIADALGWPTFTSNGGRWGPTQQQHTLNGWVLAHRALHRGEVLHLAAVAVRDSGWAIPSASQPGPSLPP